ncbi:MAG: TIGR00730 family Rossman fold protein, partial [Betaproteobacteria bacterium]
TAWSMSRPSTARHYVVCSGGGGGIMEAANRGAADAGGRTIGLNIGLPHEQRPNPYITPGLSFEFHYFFMRKLWFAHLARALVVFPGGMGTLDELTEILTLAQTGKLARPIPVVLYGPGYWKEVINFDALLRHGMISRADLGLFQYADDPATALDLLQAGLDSAPAERATPDFARSRTAQHAID